MSDNLADSVTITTEDGEVIEGRNSIYKVLLKNYEVSRDQDYYTMNTYDIYDPCYKELTILEPSVELEVNAAGSFEFTLPPFHKYYNEIRPMWSIIEVYEDDDLIWFGRPIDVDIDFYRQKKVYCEGALGFFNDSYTGPFGDHANDTWYYRIDSLHGMFQEIVLSHNNLVHYSKDSYDQASQTFHFESHSGNPGLEFTVGTITVDDKEIDAQSDYMLCSEALQSYIMDPFGGYLYPRRERDVNYLDWYKDFPFYSSDGETNQPVEFGLNLLDISNKFSGSDFCTCLLALGTLVDDEDEDNENQNQNESQDPYDLPGEPITVASINNGRPWIESEAMYEYGRIFHIEQFNDVKDRYDLLEKGRKYLEDAQFNSVTVEVSAVDLHYENEVYTKFKLGQLVHCTSEPHLIDKVFPISKISINLNSAVKQITLGTVPRKKLTDLQEVDKKKHKNNTNTDNE